MQTLTPTKIEYLVADRREENSTTKFMVPGKEMFPNVKIRVMEESRGIHITNPLKHIMIRV